MNSTLSLLLKGGERIYLNGAVIRVDRKVRIEVLNDATILLGTHIMQPEDAVTPLKQIYFAVQAMLIEPDAAPAAARSGLRMVAAAFAAIDNIDILKVLASVAADIEAEKPYAALKRLRAVFPLEAVIISGADDAKHGCAA
jgi:flagellar biosynthesis repressor protein FlbT